MPRASSNKQSLPDSQFSRAAYPRPSWGEITVSAVSKSTSVHDSQPSASVPPKSTAALIAVNGSPKEPIYSSTSQSTPTFAMNALTARLEPFAQPV
ncbi:hypothetical protein D9758_009358 [Tetrapyrgos nigripes]|uniref:Uncharacterized protein n=1 Tax=Tetrapyrgos nigripes TaxID=182062 RepID=A0A8H5LPL2_9AGAR|nr:hypothetical protein D9758_009358 [Tetrapyrgos nigripes]